MAFDPEHDDPELLRTVVMLLRAAALAASARTGATEIATAEEKIDEALEQLGKIDEIKKSAGLSPSTPRRSTASLTASTPASGGCSSRRSPRWERSMTRSPGTTSTSLWRKL